MNTPLTLSHLTQAKALAPAFLAELDLHNLEHGGVAIPYYDEAGKELLVKRRTAVRAGDGSFWPRGQPLRPYGLWKLADARSRPEPTYRVSPLVWVRK
jgi:hypothetical protein